MASKTASMSLSEIMRKGTIISDGMKRNAEKIGRYGLDMPAFTEEMDADLAKGDLLDKEQELLKSQLKAKTEELNMLQEKLAEKYALAKKTVKLAEPQTNWLGYGIDDKR